MFMRCLPCLLAALLLGACGTRNSRHSSVPTPDDRAPTAANQVVRVNAIGCFGTPDVVSLSPSEGTLSEAIERSGGITKYGRRELRLTCPIDNTKRTLAIDMLKFYEGTADYNLPDETVIFVSECNYTGTGNFTRDEFLHFEAARSDYLRRRSSGEIKPTPLPGQN